MNLSFTKLHGLGNDFVLIYRDQKFTLPKSKILKIANRKTGVGFDQMLLVYPEYMRSRVKKSKATSAPKWKHSLKTPLSSLTYRLIIYNTDGSRAEMCGNGIRAAAFYLFKHVLKRANHVLIHSDAGVRACQKISMRENSARIECEMGWPSLIRLTDEFNKRFKSYRAQAVDSGYPHLVLFYTPKSQDEFEKMGAYFERHPEFKNRTNVQFVTRVEKMKGSESRLRISIKVWERGVGETKACGSGAVASAFAFVNTLSESMNKLNGIKKNSVITVEVNFPGGTAQVKIDFEKKMTWLTGEAVEVFSAFLKG